MLSKAVEDYLFDLHQATRFTREQSEVDGLYGGKFLDLSKKYFGDKTAWPSKESIASFHPDPATGKGSDELFLCFYKEMTDRHSRWGESGGSFAQDALSSWSNYLELFERIGAVQDPEMTINEQWAFDLVQEFVYNFQTFAQTVADMGRVESADVEVLKENPDLWSVAGVSKALLKLVKQSNCEAIIKASPNGEVRMSRPRGDIFGPKLSHSLSHSPFLLLVLC